MIQADCDFSQDTVAGDDRNRWGVMNVILASVTDRLDFRDLAMNSRGVTSPIKVDQRGRDELAPTSKLSGDLLAIANLDNEDDQLLVLNRIDDPIVAFSDAIEVIFSGELLHAWRTGIGLQGLHTFDEAFLNGRGKRAELAFSRRGEKNRIGHEWLEAEIFENRVGRLRPFFLHPPERICLE